MKGRKILRKLATIGLLAVCLVLLASPLVAVASDVSNASFITRILAMNSGGAASNIAQVFTLSTSDMITAGMLNSTATDVAIRTSGGTDVAFMPSVNSTVPWSVMVPSVAAGSQADLYMYSGNVTGGLERYFPGPTGMVVADNDTSLEPSSNFTFSTTGYVNTDNGTGKYILQKSMALDVKVSDTVAGNITASIGTTGTKESYEANDGSFGVDSVHWGAQSFTHGYDLLVSSIQLYCKRVNTPANITIGIRAVDANVKPTGGDLISGTASANGWSTSDAWNSVTITTNSILNASTTYTMVVRISGTDPNFVTWERDESASAYTGGKATTSSDSGATWATPSTTIDFAFRVVGTSMSDNIHATATGVSSGNQTITLDQQYMLSFDGNDYVNCGNSTAFNLTDAVTVMVLCRPSVAIPASDEYLFCKGSDRYMLQHWSGSGRFRFYIQGAGINLSSTTVSTANTPYLVGGTYDRVNAYLYVNGVQEGAVAKNTAILTDAEPLRLGSFYFATSFFTGNMSEVCLYSRALSAVEMSAVYNTGTFPTSGLVGKWNLSEGTGTTAYDTSGNSNNGTITGASWVSPFLRLYASNTLKATGVGASVPNISANYTLFANNAMPYVQGANITVGGNWAGSWAWQYGSYFYDASGHGNTGIPSFRTTNSNSDVTLAIQSQVAVATNPEPVSPVGGGWTMVKDVPVEPTNLYHEGGTSFPGGAEINQLATDTRIPYMAWMIPIAFGSAILCSVLVYGSMHSRKTGQNGSLFMMWITFTVVMVIWYIGGGGVMPGWVLIPPGIWALFLMIWFNPFKTPIGG